MRDVRRFYVVLSPEGRKQYRTLIVGAKQLPEIKDGGDRNWAFVDMVTDDPQEIKKAFEHTTYETKTRGERLEPAARPAGEGVYALARHGDHTHLLYDLELPDQPGDPQHDLNIEEEGSYIISVRNPEAPAPPSARLQGHRRSEFPEALKERFGRRKFLPVDPPEYLDYEGAEILLIGAAEDFSEELGLELDAEDESERTAEIFQDLRLRKSEHPLEPLFQGKWK